MPKEDKYGPLPFGTLDHMRLLHGQLRRTVDDAMNDLHNAIGWLAIGADEIQRREALITSAYNKLAALVQEKGPK